MYKIDELGISYIPEVAERIKAKKYADIMLDWTFKYVFGPSGKYQEGLVSLLNSIIPDVNIKSIEYMPTEILGQVAEQKTSVLDLRCISEDGSMFAVEIQNYREDGFFKRCIAYACKLFLEQNKKGSAYGKLMPVYVVAILSEEASSGMSMYKKCKDQVIFDHTIIERFSGVIVPRIISVIFADTGNFRKDIKDCDNDVDKWFFMLKHSTRMQEYSNEFQSEVFRRILKALEISSFTQEEFNMYYTEERLKEIRQAQDDTIRRISKEEGFAEGRAEGIAEGIAEGEIKKVFQIARKMLEMGMDLSSIAKATGLALKDIQELQSEAVR